MLKLSEEGAAVVLIIFLNFFLGTMMLVAFMNDKNANGMAIMALLMGAIFLSSIVIYRENEIN